MIPGSGDCCQDACQGDSYGVEACRLSTSQHFIGDDLPLDGDSDYSYGDYPYGDYPHEDHPHDDDLNGDNDYSYGNYPYGDYPHEDYPRTIYPSELASSFNCQNPEYILEDTCVVEHPDYIGDGWCDWNLGGDDWFGSSYHHNVEACGYDGGDCCQTTCQGTLCGQNGYHCQDPNATTAASLYSNNYPGDEYPGVGESNGNTSDESSSAPPTSSSLAAENDPPPPSPAGRARELTNEDSGAQTLYTALEDIVANACKDEMARCFEDESGPCGRLFMVGSASLASSPLQNLLKCIRDFDGNGVLPTSYLDGMDGEHGECIAQNCRVEYMQCHVSMDCFLGTGTNALRQLLDECHASFCTFTAMPTASPTLRPTLAGGNAAIGFIIEADGKQFKMEHKQITAGNLGGERTRCYGAITLNIAFAWRPLIYGPPLPQNHLARGRRRPLLWAGGGRATAAAGRFWLLAGPYCAYQAAPVRLALGGGPNPFSGTCVGGAGGGAGGLKGGGKARTGYY